MTDTESGLIILKCHNCKQPTLFRLDIYPDGIDETDDDGVEYAANSYCAACEDDEPRRSMHGRTLEPELVKKQRVDGSCHEAESTTDHGEYR